MTDKNMPTVVAESPLARERVMPSDEGALPPLMNIIIITGEECIAGSHRAQDAMLEMLLDESISQCESEVGLALKMVILAYLVTCPGDKPEFTSEANKELFEQWVNAHKGLVAATRSFKLALLSV